MGIYPALEGCLALGSLQMYAVVIENCLQKQISWYISMWDTDYLIYFQGFFKYKSSYLREEGDGNSFTWKESHILLARLTFLSHVF